MTEYKFDAVRWCKSRARSARAQRNFADENSFVQVAREVEDLRARLAEAEAKRDGLKNALIYILEECYWKQSEGGDNEIGTVAREALTKLEEK